MSWEPSIDTINSLVTLDQVNGFLSTTPDTALTYLLNFYINSASWLCNTRTKRLLKSRSLTEYYSGDNTNTILVNNYPITTITAVYIDSTRTFDSDTLIDSDNLVYMPDKLANQLIYDNNIFTLGIRNIEVQYIAGYVVIPYDLQQACLEIIAYFYLNTEEKRFGVESRNIGDGSVTIDTFNIPKSASDTLVRYKRKW